MPNCFGNKKEHCRSTEVDFLIVPSKVLGLFRFGGWSIDYVAYGQLLSWTSLQVLPELFPLSTQNCPTVGKLPKLLRRAKQSKKVRTTQEVARHWKQSSVFGDQVTYACPSRNAIGTWVIKLFLLFPHRPR